MAQARHRAIGRIHLKFWRFPVHGGIASPDAGKCGCFCRVASFMSPYPPHLDWPKQGEHTPAGPQALAIRRLDAPNRLLWRRGDGSHPGSLSEVRCSAEDIPVWDPIRPFSSIMRPAPWIVCAMIFVPASTLMPMSRPYRPAHCYVVQRVLSSARGMSAASPPKIAHTGMIGRHPLG